jgi:predicted MPP superfamily phosphohydrolase
MLVRWFPFFLILLIIQWYAYQAVKTANHNKWWLSIYGLTVLLILGNFFWQLISFERSEGWNHAVAYAIGFFIALISFQSVLILFLFFEDISRVLNALVQLMNSEKTFSLPGRRKFISQLALGLGAIPFTSLLYGMYQGRYNYKVLKYVLEYEDLPENFDGFKIAQISDLHCGSFDNFDKVVYGTELIKQQNADVISPPQRAMSFAVNFTAPAS